jgi:hypothetical protein
MVAASTALMGLYGAMFVKIRQHRCYDAGVAAQSRFAIATALPAVISVLLQGLERLLH